MKALRAICCWAILVGGQPLHAEESDDAIPGWAKQVSFDFVPWCRVGDHQFVFEKTTLADVIEALHGGVIRRNGSPGAAIFTYFVDYTDGRNRISFQSNSDMGGDDHQLEGVEIEPLSSAGSARNLPFLRLPVVFPFGAAALSMPDLKKRLGTAAVHQGRFYYVYAGKTSGKDYSGKVDIGDVTVTLEGNVVEGKVMVLSAWHVTSF